MEVLNGTVISFVHVYDVLKVGHVMVYPWEAFYPATFLESLHAVTQKVHEFLRYHMAELLPCCNEFCRLIISDHKIISHKVFVILSHGFHKKIEFPFTV